MQRMSLSYLRCVRCHKKLTLDVLLEDTEIEEGFLKCAVCNLTYPIIRKIPILWDDFGAYIKNRPRLGGRLLTGKITSLMKQFLKKSMSGSAPYEDNSIIEDRWAKIYQNSKRSWFYGTIYKTVEKTKFDGPVLEHGCSIGLVTNKIKDSLVFGIDKSFSALEYAQKVKGKNCDYFVADSLAHPFGSQKFDLVICLNMLELVEPRLLLKTVLRQSGKTLIISDPYDFERGSYSVSNPIDHAELCSLLAKSGFKIESDSQVSWSLTINSRTRLKYLVDLIVGMKKP